MKNEAFKSEIRHLNFPLIQQIDSKLVSILINVEKNIAIGQKNSKVVDLIKDFNFVTLNVRPLNDHNSGGTPPILPKLKLDQRFMNIFDL